MGVVVEAVVVEAAEVVRIMGPPIPLNGLSSTCWWPVLW